MYCQTIQTCKHLWVTSTAYKRTIAPSRWELEQTDWNKPRE